MGRVGGRAVVVGASMAGLLAARVLADAYEHVTVLDRDQLGDDNARRRGVPQGAHAHALLPGGQAALDELFPGLTAELVAGGAATGDGLGQLRWHLGGHRFRRPWLGVEGLFATRPFIESRVRARTSAIPNIDITDRCDVLGLTAHDGTVDGVRLLRRLDGSAEEVLAADLVVDCSGRGSRTPARLSDLGFGPPPEDGTRLGLGYASRLFRVPPGTLGDDRAVMIDATVQNLRGGVMFAVEGDRWLVTLSGLLGEHPPTDDRGFAAFARSLAAPDIADATEQGHALSDPVAFKYPASLRRRYEALRSFPDGLLVMGDAVASFNPIYGQGMTVAALEAQVLQRLLERGRPPSPRQYFARIAKVVDVAWDMALGADLSYPQVEGERTRRTRMLNRYAARAQAAAARDATVAGTFIRVTGLVDPPQRLLAPRVAWRVLRKGHGPRPARSRSPIGRPIVSCPRRPREPARPSHPARQRHPHPDPRDRPPFDRGRGLRPREPRPEGGLGADAERDR
ncbi:MAG TPA: hypothetical protein VM388_10640 [Acidimicrobiales bacterium]|nr:hypothetical protein [Acidimicrobiales bacterium]